MLNFYRRAITLRKRLEFVRSGAYREYQKSSNKFYVYARERAGERLLVICSFSERAAQFRAPKGYELEKGQLLLHNYPDAPLGVNGFTARPYETRVYLFE